MAKARFFTVIFLKINGTFLKTLMAKAKVCIRIAVKFKPQTNRSQAETMHGHYYSCISVLFCVLYNNILYRVIHYLLCLKPTYSTL